MGIRAGSAVLAIAAVIGGICPALGVEMQPQKGAEVVMKMGNRVHLFHSGTGDVKKTICKGDTVPVYREMQTGGHLTVKEVGKVKILGTVGNNYYDAQVVEGEIKPGDIVRKSQVACRVE